MYLVATFFHLILLDSGIGLISLCSLTSYSNAVAPHAGAWIETAKCSIEHQDKEGRASRRRVD